MTTPQRVLVVDDNPATQYSTARVLRSAGYQVDTAATGQSALQLATEHLPVTVVLDINLPDMDGFDVCRRLRATPVTARIPVVCLSATFVDDIDKVHGLDAGADAYLTHPVEPPVLLATVAAMLRASRAEEALAATEAKFKAVFDSAIHGIALLSEDLIFLDLNQSMADMIGRGKPSIIGRHVSAFAAHAAKLRMSEVSNAIARHGRWSGTVGIIHASGNRLQLDWTISRHLAPNVYLAMVTDITERLLLDADRERLLTGERMARQSAEEANRTKDEFLAALSHELRTPLNAIVGFSRVLSRLPGLTDDPDAAASVQAIERNALVQAQLISDLLDISRITSGKLDLDRQAVRPADTIEAALGSLGNAARIKEVEIHADLDRNIDAIWWDPARFQQVVWNLVDNAVKFSNLGGTVSVRLFQDDSMVVFEVSDSGRGISPSFLPYVFDRFRQEEATTRRGHGGLGLGLAIVHQLVTAHGGRITVSSEGEDKGATFTVLLPRVSLLPMAIPEATLDVPVNLRGRTVVIVDDNDDARVLLRRLLAEAGARVIDVSNVPAAFDAVEQSDPDIVISDLAMPGQDGYDFITELRAKGWTPDRLPAIALSAFARPEDERRSLQATYQAHLSKPLDPGAFLAHVSSLLKDAPVGPADVD